MDQKEYHEYLNSSRWKNIRDKVLMRDGYVCQGCYCMTTDVDVHHITYDHIGNEFMFELVTLCKECHERIHTEKE